MLNRRQFIFGSSVVVSSLLAGCQDKPLDLQIVFLKGSLPLQLINNLSQHSKKIGTLKLNVKSSISELYNLLLTQQGKEVTIEEDKLSLKLPTFSRQSPSRKNDLVTLGNYWLTSAIREELIEPLDISKLNNWSRISPSFQKLVTRNSQGNLSETGKIWGAPYRWGCTMIAYRNDKFKALGWQPTDWHDLWNEDIKHRLSLPNQPREIIGLTLKKLGYSYNSENIDTVNNLLAELKALHQQVKFYDDKNYLQPLILGNTWLAVGWSADILPIMERYHNISAIVPLSGTALWADMWVQPKQGKNNNSGDKIYPWIDFCWQSKSAKQINLFTRGMSTVEVASNLNDQYLPITLDIFNQSEFIEHLPEQSLQKYKQIWQQMI